MSAGPNLLPRAHWGLNGWFGAERDLIEFDKVYNRDGSKRCSAAVLGGSARRAAPRCEPACTFSPSAAQLGRKLIRWHFFLLPRRTKGRKTHVWASRKHDGEKRSAVEARSSGRVWLLFLGTQRQDYKTGNIELGVLYKCCICLSQQKQSQELGPV